jgi:hypothetical protein
MKLLSCSHVDISVLKGALLISPGGIEYTITGISLSLDDFLPWIHIVSPDIKDSESAIPFDSTIKDWSVQIGNNLYG